VPRVACLTVLVCIAWGCGGKSLSAPADSGADVSGAGAHGADGFPGVTGLVASNGVPIPDPNLKTTCASFGAVVSTCSLSNKCPPLSCDCAGGNKVMIDVPVSCEAFGRCLTAVSCAAACELGDAARGDLEICVYQGVCKTDGDCPDDNPRCLLAPGQASGICESGFGRCFQDADCLSGPCVAAGGVRICSDRKSGSICNRHDQCADGTCVLAGGAFAGSCTNGTNGAPCLDAAQCLASYTCVANSPLEGMCSSHGKGAPCATDDDCLQGLCGRGDFGLGKCDTGEPGAPCMDASDCRSPRVPICYQRACSAGTNGSPCAGDADCATLKCASIAPGLRTGQCTDGKAGSPCTGARSEQCEAGLRCISNGFNGVCVAGAAGDPCLRGADCASGECPGGTGGVPTTFCPGAADLAPCGGQGACVAQICFPICGSGGDAGAQ
jgi:hypothetical protein